MNEGRVEKKLLAPSVSVSEERSAPVRGRSFVSALRILTNAKTMLNTSFRESVCSHKEAHNYLLDDWFAAYVVDIDDEATSGVTTPRALREENVSVPIVGISKEASEPTGEASQKWKERYTEFLNQGGNALLKQPVGREELDATIYALLRLARGFKESIIRTGDLAVNLTSGMVTYKGIEIPLSAYEYRLLSSLALRIGRVVSKEHIMIDLYGGVDEPEIKILDIFVFRIRKKIKAIDPTQKRDSFIEAVCGRGYRLIKK